MEVTILARKASKNFWLFENEELDQFFSGVKFALNDYYKIKSNRDSQPDDVMSIHLTDIKPSSYRDFDAKWDFRRVDNTQKDTMIYFDEFLQKEVFMCEWINEKFGSFPNNLYLTFTPVETA